ncbi:A/G-specific adenine glycosylase [Reichenbachiella sp. MALMAid0571]|uniref:A/G-specific adenine glycosylase n=1 Tax=Reichenbachiella sp. MALMAid0571 TaxID=3143939 RepID=UPI0032DED753
MNTEFQINLSKTFSTSLINWYEINKRDLPWRDTNNPYVIWLSEIILQQTRVQQGLPYFNKFLKTFPDIEAFANASEQDILKLWQGLGYYSRARNMLVCAKEVVNEHNGQFPPDFNQLLKLKGIGKYTAAAIASFSFKQTVPVLDGNVFRVLSRIYGIENDISETSSHKVFWNKAESLIPHQTPDKFNQAIMEFGALQCVPKSPNCNGCAFKTHCFAYKHGLQDVLPVKKKKVKKKIRHFNYFVIVHDDKVLVKERKTKDIWKGMYDFLLLETPDEQGFDQLMVNQAKFLSDLGNIVTSSSNFKHILTHQTIFAKFFVFSIDSRKDFGVIKRKFDLEEVETIALDTLPISRLMDKYLKKETNYLT